MKHFKAAMVEKLPPSCTDFKHYLKHKRKEMTIEDLVARLRIKEDNKMALKRTLVETSPKTNMVEHAQSSRGFKGNKGHRHNPKSKNKGVDLGPRKGGVKKKFGPFKGKCYNCHEAGHKAEQCTKPKRDKAMMVDDEGPLVAMVSDGGSSFGIK